jgi:hypothetical protein
VEKELFFNESKGPSAEAAFEFRDAESLNESSQDVSQDLLAESDSRDDVSFHAHTQRAAVFFPRHHKKHRNFFATRQFYYQNGAARID